jgi:phospholipid transport system substrate-binding protein
MMTRHIAGILAVLGCLGAALPLPARAQAASQAPAGATAPIAALNAGLETLEKNAAKPFPARYDDLAPLIDHAFNLPQILKTIVGLRWSSIPAAQQQTLLGVFRAYTICNYVGNFNTDSGDHFAVLPASRAVGADQVVETEIVPKSGDSVRIDYVMRPGTGGSWQAIDVLQEGTISQAAVQRSDFRSLLAAGNADALIASLRQKIATLSGGTIKP